MSSVKHICNLQDENNAIVNEENARQEVTVVKDNMDNPQDVVEAKQDSNVHSVATKNDQPVPEMQNQTDQETGEKKKAIDDNSVPLDKFKRRLVRAVARHMQLKKPEEEMWKDLKDEIGCDCKMLWQRMRALTLKKLKRLLPANDLLVHIKKIARLTATDWLLFDLILVHEKINVISSSDTSCPEEEYKEEAQCLHELFELVNEHKVEWLVGKNLTEAWTRVTLEYNRRGRQCSPMMLQLRWYQLKELTRANFYNFWCSYRGNQKMLERALKIKPTSLQAAVAREYRHVITQPYREWEKLIETRHVILSQEFTINREVKLIADKFVEENDVEVELIEPVVETIELEVESDEEHHCNYENTSNKENSNVIENKNQDYMIDADKNCTLQSAIISNCIRNIKSESDDDVLDLDGLSDMETMHIPLEILDKQTHTENFIQNSIEETSKSTEDHSLLLPKITNVFGNMVELTDGSDKRDINTIIEKTSSNGLKDVITKTMINVNACKEFKDLDLSQYDLDVKNGSEHTIARTKDTDTIHCESEEEIDTILQEKADSIISLAKTQIISGCELNIEISASKNENPTYLELHPKILNETSCKNKNDSDDETDKFLEEKTNEHVMSEMSDIQVKTVDKALKEKSTHVINNEDAIEDLINNKKSMVSDKKDSVNMDKYDDGFDDTEFDDEQIEFVDDGIEFIEERVENNEKKMELKIEPLTDADDESINDCHKIDLKLLMNPIVYTKKLEVMDTFKFFDYTFVNDKKVIECAIFESKPIDKHALNDNDFIDFRDQAIRGYEIDDDQTESDIQTGENNAKNKVKCTSYLLQKPKNRKYNPIQLCKNPDFNTRLKRLTAGFLSSTRNRVLLKECKPLTIDLHKAFESKLIDGTMYLESGDFKSATVQVTGSNINNQCVSVLPSVIPGQSMIPPPPITNNILIGDRNKLDNVENNLTSSTIAEKGMFTERRKIINLPDIDQVRRINQSLLTAEVTPMRIDSTMNIDNSCKEIENIPAEPVFVQPITLTPILQVVKNEPSDSIMDTKSNIQTKLNQTQYDITLSKDLIANKINDQIIDLSNQISDVENNDKPSVSSKKAKESIPKIRKKPGRKPKSKDEILKVYQQVKVSYVPKYPGKLTWSPKYPKNYVADSLLTLDTLSKILSILNGIEEKYCSCKKKSFKEAYNCQQNNSKNLLDTNEEDTNKDTSDVTERNNILGSTLANDVLRTKGKNSVRSKGLRRKKNKPRNLRDKRKYTGVYCCWAREKIMSITKDFIIGKHTCFPYQCICCCRQELIKVTFSKGSALPNAKGHKKPLSTIILSDDEDLDKNSHKNEEIEEIDSVSKDKGIENSISHIDLLDKTLGISNATMQPDEVSAKTVLPPISAINEEKVLNDGIQPKISQDKSSIGAPSLLLSKETDLLKNQKTCKTIVHSAVGHTYNRFPESINSNVKENNSSVALNSTISTCNKEQEKHSKQTEHTLFLNSSQIMNQSLRTPIYLGKNKILLCSLKRPNVTTTSMNPYLPVLLPYGVNLVILPSGELTLSIDNGVQLDSEQLSALPALMSTVQEQFLKSNMLNKTPEYCGILKENEDVRVVEENTVAKQTITSSAEYIDNTSKVNKSTQSDCLITSAKDILSEDTRVQTTLLKSNSDNFENSSSLTVNNKNYTSTIISNVEQTDNMKLECTTVVEGHKVIEKPLEITNCHLAVDDQENSSKNNKSSSPSPKPCDKDKNDNSRKTILSDLMEMSGISPEDTATSIDDMNSCPSITPLPPTIIPVTGRTSGNGRNMVYLTPSNDVPENISIAGPSSNLLSFEPTTPTNQLLNYIGQIRPELNVVTSFLELKYVYENDGIFYKLDVDSGIISEIKVHIKKNSKSLSSMTPKAFIDLTDEKDDSENEVTCAEFQDVPHAKQENAVVKPIKLFKSIHPAILKHKGRSILKDNEVVYPKKLIRINKYRRKQLLNVGNKYILIDVKNKNESTQSEHTSTSNLDSSYDSSDEEPLAKKCKRNKRVGKDNDEIQVSPLFVDPPEPFTSIANESVGINEAPDRSDECDDMTDIEMNNMDIEGVNPELHPVAFEEGSESDEEMCILGV